jgi:hypothetical protein
MPELSVSLLGSTAKGRPRFERKRSNVDCIVEVTGVEPVRLAFGEHPGHLLPPMSWLSLGT